MDHLTFGQQVIMAITHQIGSVLTTICGLAIFWAKFSKKHDDHREKISVMLNGGLESRIRKAVREALGKTDEDA